MEESQMARIRLTGGARIAPALALALLVLTACPRPEGEQQPDTTTGGAPSPTAGEEETTAMLPPALVEEGASIDNMLHADFLQAARKLAYVDGDSPDDERDLWYLGTKGPNAKIEIVGYWSLIDAAQLASTAGRIVGRIVTPAGSDFDPFAVKGTVTYVWVGQMGSSNIARTLWVRGDDPPNPDRDRVRDRSKEYRGKGGCERTPCTESASSTYLGPDAGAVASFASLRRAGAQVDEKAKFDRLLTVTDSVTSQGCWKTSTGWVCSPSKIR
jgi:hypothetical protein